MKLSVERNTFLKALTHGQSVVEKKTTLPILSNILLAADGVTLKLTSTDLELSLVESCSSDVQEPGRTTVPAHLLYDIVRKLREGSKVEMQLDKATNRLLITSGKSEYKLPCLPTEDFPAISQGELPHKFQIQARTLRKLFDSTKFAMSNEETRYFLNGIYLHVVNGDTLRAVATDGHRLAQVSAPLPPNAEDMPGVIVSRKTVNEISKLLSDIQDDITISLSTTQICFSVLNATLTARLIDGKYPDYTLAIPQNADNVFHLRTKQFSQAVDRVATIANNLASGIKLNIASGCMTLTAVDEATGDAHEEVEVDYQGDTVCLGLSSKYLLDVTQQIEEEETKICMSDSAGAIIMRACNDDSALFVLMPMRV